VDGAYVSGRFFDVLGVTAIRGLAFGLAGSLWAARFVEALLFRLDGRDPMTFAGAASSSS
jgi:hypothetical protein